MEDYVKDTIIASPYPFWITMLLFVGISAFINYLIVYSKEKARRKVEEETAARITKKIESVKDSYNKALETHKIELKKEFESARHIIELCKNLDKELINHLIVCKNDIESDGSYESEGRYGCAVNSIMQLGCFLHIYESRYSNLKDFNKLLKECDNMNSVFIDLDNNKFIHSTNYSSVTDKAQKYIKSILKTIIPPIKVGSEKNPEQ